MVKQMLTNGGADVKKAKVDSAGKGWWKRLAAKAGKPPRGGSLAETNLLNNAASATAELLDAIEDDPNVAIHLAQSAKKKDFMYERKQESNVWPGYTRVKRIPKYWFAAYLLNLSDGALDRDTLNRLEEKHPMAVRTIVYWTHQITDSTELTVDLQDKSCCTFALRQRHAALGHRLRKLLDRTETWNLSTGDFGEQSLNSYDLVCVGSKVSAVRHVGSGLSQPLRPEDVQGDFEIHSHLDDMHAFLKSDGGRRLYFAELWKKPDGPWQADPKLQGMQLSDFGAEYTAQQRAKAIEAPVVKGSETILDDAKAKRHADVLEQARQKLQSNRQQEKVRKIIRVKMPAPSVYQTDDNST